MQASYSSNPKEEDWGELSDSLAVVTAPTSTTNVRQTGATTNSAVISWTKAEGASGYDVYYGSECKADSVDNKKQTFSFEAK